MNKPLNKKNYGSIPHLLGSKLGEHDHFIEAGQHKICTEKTRDWKDLIIVSEKIDGSNVGISKVNGKLEFLTRSGYRCEDSEYETHYNFVNYAYKHLPLQSIQDLLSNGQRLVFEWLDSECLTGTKHFNKGVYLLDYFYNEYQRVSYIDLVNYAGKLNLLLPKLVHIGQPVKPEKLMKGLVSDYTTEKPEGLVYRVERQGKFDFMAKFVRQNFEAGKYLKEKTI